MVPFVIHTIIGGAWLPAGLLCLGAAVTDVIDGSLARALGQESDFGQCLDPIADKLFLVSSYMALWSATHAILQLPFWFLLAVVLREGILLVAGGWLLLCGSGNAVRYLKPSIWGKVTTVLHFIFLGLFWGSHLALWELSHTDMTSLLLVLTLCMVGSTLHYIIRMREALALCW
jgi:cardiolipin synthase